MTTTKPTKKEFAENRAVRELITYCQIHELRITPDTCTKFLELEPRPRCFANGPELYQSYLKQCGYDIISENP